MEKVLNDFKEQIKEEIKKIMKKGDLTPAELDNGMKAVCLVEKINEILEGSGGMDYSQGWMPPTRYPDYSYEDMNSHARSRSPVTGRYISHGMHGNSYTDMSNGYSGHSINDRMIARLEDMYDSAKTEHERETVDRWIKRIRSDQ